MTVESPPPAEPPGPTDAPVYEWRRAAWLAAASAATLLALLVAWWATSDVGLALRDPVAVARAGDDIDWPFVGWLSHAGVLLWALSASVALFAGRLIQLREGSTAASRCLLGAGLVSTAMCVDDLLLIHDNVAPRVLGVGEAPTILLLVAVASIWAAAFRDQLLRNPDLPVLLLAAGAFAVSLIAEPFGFLGEDAFKLVGIACWSVFVWRTAMDGVRVAES